MLELKRDSPYWTIQPMPRSAPRYSPRMAPITAKPTHVRRLAKIHVRAEGKSTWRTRSPRLPPITRTWLIRFTSTSRSPAYVLKKMMKKTRLTTMATLEASPIPSHTMKRGARAIRGMALKTTISGWNSSARNGEKAKSTPTSTPPRIPMARPMTASWMVAQRWT